MSRRISVSLLFFLFCSTSVSVAKFIPKKTQRVVPPVFMLGAHKPANALSGGPFQHILRKQILSSGVTNLGQILQSNGLQLQDSTGNGAQVAISMRGFGGNAVSNTLFLINGFPITNPDIAPLDLNVIPIAEIEYVEIIAGTESVLYGDQAVGGVINIVTRKAVKPRTELSCSLGSYHQYNCSLAVFNQYHNLAYNFLGLHIQTDNYREHNAYTQSLLLGGFRYTYSSGELNLDYNLGKENMQYPGALTRAQVRANRRQATNDTDFFKNADTYFHLQNEQVVLSNWTLTSDLLRRERQGKGVLSSPFTQDRLVYFFKPTLKGKWGNNPLALGIDIQSDRYHLDTLFGLTQVRQQKYGGFGIINILLHRSWWLSLGMRGAGVNNQVQADTATHAINRAFVTTIGLNYQMLPQATIYLRRAESFRFPKSDEITFTPNNTLLRTQRGVAYEAGLQYKNQPVLLKLGIYQLNLKDEIAFDPMPTPQQPFGSNRNLPPTIRRGLSFSTRSEITQTLSIGGQYNYVNARFQTGINAGNRIPLVAENIFLANINYQRGEFWNFYLEGVYTGNQYAANDDANITPRLGGYTVYNFNLRYQKQAITASLRLNNIFNKNYYYYAVYQSNNEFFYPAAGRNILLTLKYTFA